MAEQSYKAGGNITPSRFVKISGEQTVVAAGSNERVDGIAQRYPRDAQLSGASALAGASGDSILVHVPDANDREVLLEIGSGGCSAGERLISDTNGKGITMPTTAGTQQNVGAIAQEDADENGFCLVQVTRELVTHET